MFFRQYYVDCLSHASYLVGDESTGRAVVIDPQRDVSVYLDDAAANGLRIERVIETHFHADFLSGHLELAAATGATISYGDAAAGRAEFPVEYLTDDTRLSLGDVTLEIRATPGHTPESICVVVYEHADDTVPYGVCTGDTLFIGDVGRPDLLASVGVTADELARNLYRSVHDQLLTLPDDTRVFPAHGAGSACGKHLANETESTIGIQRRTNYALAPMSEDDFVEAVTTGQATAPMYFAFAAQKNAAAHGTLDETAPVPQLTYDEFAAETNRGAVALDTRSAIDFEHGHIHNALSVALDSRFADYAGQIIPAGTPIVLITDPGREQEARNRLARIGFDTVVGALTDPVSAMASHLDDMDRAQRLNPDAFDDIRMTTPGITVVDVRSSSETELGAIAGAVHIPLAELINRMDELDRHAPLIVYCASGTRSTVAASALRAHGFTEVSDLRGGYDGWRASEGAERMRERPRPAQL